MTVQAEVVTPVALQPWRAPGVFVFGGVVKMTANGSKGNETENRWIGHCAPDYKNRGGGLVGWLLRC